MTARSLRPCRRMPENARELPPRRSRRPGAAPKALVTLLLATLALAGAGTAGAAGRVVHVSPRGSDSNPGTSSAPWRSLSKAFASLRAGDTAVVHSGTYGRGDTSALTWAGQGGASAPITVAAAPGAKPVLAQLVKMSGSYLRLRGFTVVRNSYPTDSRFGQSGSNPGGSVNLWATGCSFCSIEQNEIRGATMSGLFVNDSDGIRVVANWIHDNGTTHDDHGIYFCSGRGGLVAKNLIERNYDFGLQLYCGNGGPSGTIVTDNTIVANGTAGSGGSGIVAEVQNGRIVNNVIADNLEFGIRGWSGGSATISGNRLYGNGGGPFYALETGYRLTGNVTQPPKGRKGTPESLRAARLAQIRKLASRTR